MPVPTLFKILLSSPCLVACMVALPAHAADNCEPLRAGIEANIASKGLSDFSVSVVDEASELPGQVVGHCGNGSKKILYVRGSSLGPSPAAAAASVAPAPNVAPQKPASPPVSGNAKAPASGQGMLTECKDGTVSVGGSCKR
jgi:hypothetical protein